jgi:kynurenine formamidase
MFLGTHTGTHMDAPFHFNANAPAIDQIEIQKDSNQMITGDDILNNSKYEIKENL